MADTHSHDPETYQNVHVASICICVSAHGSSKNMWAPATSTCTTMPPHPTVTAHQNPDMEHGPKAHVYDHKHPAQSAA
jgi:hypothetical protein